MTPASDSPGVASFNCSTHLPGLFMDGDEPIALGAGELATLRPAEWSVLDPFFSESTFESLRPVFYRGRLASSPDEGPPDAYERWREVVRGVYEALLLVLPERLPDPGLSMTYVERGGAVRRVYGAFGREYLIGTADLATASVDEADLRSATAVSELLAQRGLRSLPEVDAALATLERTARPELSAVNDFVHSAILVESVLMPEVRRQLGQTFSQRGAVLLAAHDGELDEAAEHCRAVYRFRSEALHGGHPFDAVPEGWETDEFLGAARWLVCIVARRLMAFAAVEHTDDPAGALRDRLVQGWDDAEVREDLQRVWAAA